LNKLDYVNKLLDADNISDYIHEIENNNLISPPSDLKDKIIAKCYYNKSKEIKVTKRKIALIDIIKVACFALIITLCTELFMNATYASTKTNDNNLKRNEAIDKIKNKINNIMSEFSDFMLTSDLKGE